MARGGSGIEAGAEGTVLSRATTRDSDSSGGRQIRGAAAPRGVGSRPAGGRSGG